VKLRVSEYEEREYPSLENYAEDILAASDYGVGALEQALGTANNTAAALGRLLDLLADKGQISAEDTVFVVKGYVQKGVTFCE